METSLWVRSFAVWSACESSAAGGVSRNMMSHGDVLAECPQAFLFLLFLVSAQGWLSIEIDSTVSSWTLGLPLGHWVDKGSHRGSPCWPQCVSFLRGYFTLNYSWHPFGEHGHFLPDLCLPTLTMMPIETKNRQKTWYLNGGAGEYFKCKVRRHLAQNNANSSFPWVDAGWLLGFLAQNRGLFQNVPFPRCMKES